MRVSSQAPGKSKIVFSYLSGILSSSQLQRRLPVNGFSPRTCKQGKTWTASSSLIRFPRILLLSFDTILTQALQEN
jgi:hypothetical protein